MWSPLKALYWGRPWEVVPSPAWPCGDSAHSAILPFTEHQSMAGPGSVEGWARPAWRRVHCLGAQPPGAGEPFFGLSLPWVGFGLHLGRSRGLNPTCPAAGGALFCKLWTLSDNVSVRLLQSYHSIAGWRVWGAVHARSEGCVGTPCSFHSVLCETKTASEVKSIFKKGLI